MFQSTLKKNNNVIQTTRYQTAEIIRSFSQQWGTCFSLCLSHHLWKNSFHGNSSGLYITSRTAIKINFAKLFHSENKKQNWAQYRSDTWRKTYKKCIYTFAEKLRESSVKTMFYLMKKSFAESSVAIFLLDHLLRACTEHCPCCHLSLWSTMDAQNKTCGTLK